MNMCYLTLLWLAWQPWRWLNLGRRLFGLPPLRTEGQNRCRNCGYRLQEAQASGEGVCQCAVPDPWLPDRDPKELEAMLEARCWW
jgi:hypothetical protein